MISFKKPLLEDRRDHLIENLLVLPFLTMHPGATKYSKFLSTEAVQLTHGGGRDRKRTLPLGSPKAERLYASLINSY